MVIEMEMGMATKNGDGDGDALESWHIGIDVPSKISFSDADGWFGRIHLQQFLLFKFITLKKITNTI